MRLDTGDINTNRISVQNSTFSPIYSFICEYRFKTFYCEQNNIISVSSIVIFHLNDVFRSGVQKKRNVTEAFNKTKAFLKRWPRMMRRALRRAAAIRGTPATNHALRGCVERMRRRVKAFDTRN
ncbi:hypothetical protein L596_013043 [Steinernema carpocapsae]|uniref:Uncharacterized protein n=1 Tax=Steinernema carpocapsae TaxID=34508 RepID=A0A4U5NZ23_STECR|nr:hypothetical protein L596_013043 [Steinernema carpocapsae]